MEKYTLVGVDGNAYSIMGTVRKWMRNEGYSEEEIKGYTEDAKSSDYEHLLRVSLDMVDNLNAKG